MSTYARNGDRVDLPELLELGWKHQQDTDWVPPTKRAAPEAASASPSSGRGGS